MRSVIRYLLLLFLFSALSVQAGDFRVYASSPTNFGVRNPQKENYFHFHKKLGAQLKYQPFEHLSFFVHPLLGLSHNRDEGKPERHFSMGVYGGIGTGPEALIHLSTGIERIIDRRDTQFKGHRLGIKLSLGSVWNFEVAVQELHYREMQFTLGWDLLMLISYIGNDETLLGM